MKISSRLYIIVILISLSACGTAQPQPKDEVFELVTVEKKTAIIYDATGPALDSISAHLLAQDIERVTGFKPQVTNLSKF